MAKVKSITPKQFAEGGYFESTSDPKKVAEQLGISEMSVGHVHLQLDTLKSLGVLIDLNVRGTSMFTRSASWGELGIPETDIRASRLSKGQKFLIPESRVKEWRSLETRTPTAGCHTQPMARGGRSGWNCPTSSRK
jgi:hypothetical protein